MTLGEAATRYGAPVSTLRYAAAHGHMKARKLGKQWVVTGAAVEQWQAHGKHAPGPRPVEKVKPARIRKAAL